MAICLIVGFALYGYLFPEFLLLMSHREIKRIPTAVNYVSAIAAGLIAIYIVS